MSRRIALLVLLLSALTAPAFAQTKPVITVLDFKTDGVSDKEMRSIIELLSSALFNTGQYQVIDVTQRETLL
jgi:molybdopterin biosynthesis enzyme MoaB